MSAEQVLRVTPQTFARYREGLIALLVDAVHHGASVGFMANLDPAQASQYFSSRPNRDII